MHNGRGLLAALCLALSMSAVGGCNRTLFSEADPYRQERINRYWEGDSAERLSEQRQKNTGMGFGFPTGMASQ